MGPLSATRAQGAAVGAVYSRWNRLPQRRGTQKSREVGLCEVLVGLRCGGVWWLSAARMVCSDA